MSLSGSLLSAGRFGNEGRHSTRMCLTVRCMEHNWHQVSMGITGVSNMQPYNYFFFSEECGVMVIFYVSWIS